MINREEAVKSLVEAERERECPLCKSREITFVFQEIEYNVHECQSCYGRWQVGYNIFAQIQIIGKENK